MPGGSSTQLQYNNAGAFGGISGATTNGTATTFSTGNLIANDIHSIGANALQFFPSGAAGISYFNGSDGSRNNLALNNTGGTASLSNQLIFQANYSNKFSFANDSNVSGTQDFYFYDNVNAVSRIYFGAWNAGAPSVAIPSGSIFGWGPAALTIGLDTALARNAAGVVEINNGTVGQYRDLKLRTLNATNGIQINGAAPLGYDLRGDGTQFTAYPENIFSSSTASVSAGYAVDTYLAGSMITINAGDFKAGAQYHCKFDMVKTAAGTNAMAINVRVGTLGTTGDGGILLFTFGPGTAIADTGTFEVWATFRSVGSGTAAVLAGICEGKHNLATTGLFNNAASWTIVSGASGGFATNTATKIGVSFNGGGSFSGTNTIVQASLTQP